MRTWYARPAARSWTCAGEPHAAAAFHAGLPGYAPTPLVELPALATELGVGRVFVKDESSRLGLPAFKVLGASWAICRLLSARSTEPPNERSAQPPLERSARPPLEPPVEGPGNVDLDRLRVIAAAQPGLTLVTATDGNTCGGSQGYTLVVSCQTISVTPGSGS